MSRVCSLNKSIRLQTAINNRAANGSNLSSVALRIPSFVIVFVFVCLPAADKPNAKIIEDWICPTAKIAFSTRRVHDSQRTRSEQGGNDVMHTGKKSMKGVNRHSPSSSLSSSSSSSLSNDYNGDNVMQIKYIFLIVGCLSLMLLAVGVISYFFAALS